MALPKFYPHRPADQMQALCNTQCAIYGFKQHGTKLACRFPSFFTQGAPEGPRVMIIVDMPGDQQMRTFHVLGNQDDPERILWDDAEHRVLKAILSQLLGPEHNVMITHALKCESHTGWRQNHRNLIYTSAKKEPQKREAYRLLYEQEAPHFQYCMKHIDFEIAQYNPDVIITLGHRALEHFTPNRSKENYKCRQNLELEIQGRMRTVVATIGSREVKLSPHLASQWKVDIARGLWLSTEQGKAFRQIPTDDQLISIMDVNQYRQIIDYLRQTGLPFCFDTETLSLIKKENQCIMASLCFDGVHGYTIPVSAKQFLPGFDEDTFRALTKELLDLPNPKIAHHSLFDMEAVESCQDDWKWMPEVDFDTESIAYCFEEHFRDETWRKEKQPGLTGSRFNWLQLAGQVTDLLGVEDEKWFAEKDDREDMVKAILEKGWASVSRYAGKDAIYTFRDWVALTWLMRYEMKDLYDRVATYLLPKANWALARIERNGLPIDIVEIDRLMDPAQEGTVAWEYDKALAAFRKHPDVQRFSSMKAKQVAAEEAAKKAEKEAKKNAGKMKRASIFASTAPKPTLDLATPEPFNIDSSQMLLEFFFDYLKMEPVGGERTCDKTFQEQYKDHPIVSLLKTCKERGKLLGTFLPGFKNSAAQYCDGRVRASYAPLNVTGRTSCKDPNLQQIPRGDAESILGLVKSVIKARPGYALVGADFGTMELRYLAMASQDPAFIGVFEEMAEFRKQFIASPSKETMYERKKRDFHRVNASKMMKIDLDKVTKEQRTAAKTLSFRIAYDYDPTYGLAQVLGISEEESKALIDSFLGGYPKIKEYRQWLEKSSTENLYTLAGNGRRRAAWGLVSDDNKVKRHALSVVMNSPVQGPSSDICLMACYQFIKMTDAAGVSEDVRIVNAVHDAIYAEIRIDLLKEWLPKLLWSMENPEPVRRLLGNLYGTVPLEADADVCINLKNSVEWNYTPEHLDQIVEWLAAGAEKETKPYSEF
jgi:DNA polymerase I-like protein with 3'-5' exonuclease and polymerase domains/uracil-DNA glycosylase